MTRSADAPSPLEHRDHGGVTVVGFTSPYLQSDADIEAVGRELIDLVEKGGKKTLVLTFQNVRFVSSSMIACLVKLHRVVARAGGKLRICCLHPALLEALRTSRLDKLFDIAADEAEAMKKL